MARRQKLSILAIVVAGGLAYIAAEAATKHREQIRDAGKRWHVITVNRPFMEITSQEKLPEPLEDISAIASIDMRPTPDMSATEIAGRLHDDFDHSASALRRLRTALRKTEMLLETGEVLAPDAAESAEPTLWNIPLRLLTKYRYGEGRL